MGHTNYTDCAYYTIIHTNLEMWTYSSRSLEYIYTESLLCQLFSLWKIYLKHFLQQNLSNKFDTTFPGMKKFNTRQI